MARKQYVRKTRDEYEIQQRTECGWETVCTEETWAEARARVKEYRANQPEYQVRRRYHRVPLEAAR